MARVSALHDAFRARPTSSDGALLDRRGRAFPGAADEKGLGARGSKAPQRAIRIVDASARQLLAEGFGLVHNRARMISASFLAKHLLVDFRKGEELTT